MILDELASYANIRVEQAKQQISFETIKEQALALPKGSFRFEQVLSKSNLSFICEIKKASPSKGIIAEQFPYVEIAKEYEAAGADAISILTEPKWFLGSDQYLKEIRKEVSLPILRKDFVVDAYQIYEAKLLGADAILLICAILDTKTIRNYLQISDELGLSAIVEAHDEQEITSAIEAGARIIGVNNRNLKNFTVNFKNCTSLRKYIPEHILFVAESGIKTTEDIAAIADSGADAALIGETFMRSDEKNTLLQSFRSAANQKSHNKPTHKIKICGFTCEEEIAAANRFHPDFVGFVFAKSRRQISPEYAAVLRNLLEPSIPTVGVFVNEDPAIILDLCIKGVIQLIQLHGQETEEMIQSLKEKLRQHNLFCPIIKAISVQTASDISNAASLSCDYLLLDHGAGGTGQTFDWSSIPKITKPFFLAGGLNCSNIEAARHYHAYCLDLSSGAETNGKKDAEKIQYLVETIHNNL